ncbi:MAG: PAS domain S-box protein, partial [Anaerolineales bacterium]|nr:PAS domain S-box protein [Anaerolineales bacterium]
ITERKRAEEALRESEERYRAVFENTGTATIIVEEDTTISLANHEMEKLTGYSREEVEGKKSWTEFIIKKDLERMKKYHESRRINPASAPRNYESGLIDKQGNIKDVSLTIAMISGTKRSIASLLDITERKKVEEMLIESEEKYRALTENISDIAYSLDRNGILTHISPQTKKYDVAPETLISRNLLEIVHPEDRENIAKEYQRALESGEEFTSIFRILNAKGRVYWLEDLGKIQRDKDGIITGLAGVLRDITERKQAEEKLRANEQELELLLEYLPGMVFFKDSNFRYRRVNPAFTQLHKITQEEIIGKKIGEASLLNAEFAASDDLEIIESGKVSSRIIEFPDDTGGSRWQQITKVPIKDENGKIRGILGVGMDISDIIKSQEELKLRSEMLDQARNGIIVSDTNGNFVYANKVVLEERGYTQEEFLKLNVRDLVVPPDAGNFDEWWQQVVEKGYFRGEYEIRCKDGSLIPVEAILTRAKSGENDFVISVVHDITERKQMAAESAELERKAQVASRLASVGELASGIAHEINNPLTGILAFAEDMMEDLPEDHSHHSDLGVIVRETIRCREIVRNLLDFARLENLVLELRHPNEVVEDALQLVHKLPQFRNISIEKNLSQAVPPINCDKHQLQQVVLNLMLNATDAMKGQGRIELIT